MLRVARAPFLAMGLAGALAGPAAATVPARPTASAANRARLVKAMHALVAAGTPGVIVATRDGHRTLSLARGLGDVRRRVPLAAGDRFRIGSLTKTFVAALALQLVGQGRLSLDDTVERWVPGLVPNGAAISVRELLNHTSGLGDFERAATPLILRHPSKSWTPEQMIAIGLAQGQTFPPGTGWSYSNTGYLVLGRIIEKAGGRPLAGQLEARIFTPLGLRHTSIDATPRIAGHHSHGYIRIKGVNRDTDRWNPSWGWAAGAMTSTARDVLRFQRALLRARLFSRGLLDQMETAVPAFFPGEGYGLGLLHTATFAIAPIYKASCGFGWGHTGDIPGYNTFGFSSRNAKRQFVVFLNEDGESRTRKASIALTHVAEAAFCGR
jgi:D-alanyl-D-alanine carboxypeptidase